VYHWRARVIPVAFNKHTNQWNVLLGHDRNGYWSDFSLPGQLDVPAGVTAQKALSSQTNDFYNVSLQGTPQAKTPLNDILHIVQVGYADRTILQAKAKNIIKDDFVWIPLSEFSQDKKVKRPLSSGKIVEVTYGISKLIKKYVFRGVNKLESHRTAAPQSKKPALSLSHKSD
nr:hypothetical protein [Candidatus Dependentiae bacterium]